jgi:cytochrome c-type biogenesis protein CcsB
MQVMLPYLFTSALITVGASSVLYVAFLATKIKEVGKYAGLALYMGAFFLTINLLVRAVIAGRAPYSNQYEFALSFAWGILVIYIYVERQFRMRSIGAFVIPIAIGLMAYASTLPADVNPLVPALQNNLLLTVHVAMAMIAYGSFAVACGAAIMYLLQKDNKRTWLPFREDVDAVAYRAVLLGFPCMALVLILGAAWGNIAWGRYWGWDPKETAALTTWLIYAGYLHAHSLKSWRGVRSNALLLLGFAATLFTYYGNLFLGGLHSYSGL